MNTDNLDKARRQIQALLRLGADAGATDAETENALRFARRLMLKHNVSAEDLEEAKDPHEAAADVESVEYGTVHVRTVGSSQTKWELVLRWAIAELIGTVKFYSAGRVERRTDSGTLEFNAISGKPMVTHDTVFYGPAEDCRDAKEMIEEWTLTVMGLARMKFGGALRGDGRSYCEGFCDALLAKVRKIKAEEKALIAAPEQGTRSTALMVTNANQLMELKLKRADVFLEKTCHVKLSKGHSSGRGGAHNHDAYGAGQSDGRSANFDHSRTKKLKDGGA